jgi:hypothetical protein
MRHMGRPLFCAPCNYFLASYQTLTHGFRSHACKDMTAVHVATEQLSNIYLRIPLKLPIQENNANQIRLILEVARHVVPSTDENRSEIG